MEVLIYIPEDRLPKNLGGCSVEINFCGGHVSQVVMIDRYDEEGLDFTELPKGHGRLKDIDEIDWYGCTTEYDCPYKNRDCKDCDRAECSKTQVDSIPTIIPAEKDGDAE